MELFAIALSVPAAFVLSVVYSWLLTKLVGPRAPLRHAVRLVSLVVLGLIALEVVLLAVVGAVRLREVFGLAFYTVHEILFFAAVPSLANVLVLKSAKPRWWHVLLVGCICAAFALPVVLMQYGVSEALFGVD